MQKEAKIILLGYTTEKDPKTEEYHTTKTEQYIRQ